MLRRAGGGKALDVMCPLRCGHIRSPDAFRKIWVQVRVDEAIVGRARVLAGSPESTIRTHVVGAMCVDAPTDHAVTYADPPCVGRGQYELGSDGGTSSSRG